MKNIWVVTMHRNSLSDHYYVQFNLIYKPNWFHRTMMRLCFGYKWVNL